jgi:hypothetical protein
VGVAADLTTIETDQTELAADYTKAATDQTEVATDQAGAATELTTYLEVIFLQHGLSETVCERAQRIRASAAQHRHCPQRYQIRKYLMEWTPKKVCAA